MRPYLAAAALSLPLLAQVTPYALPEWWNNGKVLKPNTVSDDYAVLNQGQLKNLVKAATDECLNKLGSSASPSWAALQSQIAAWIAKEQNSESPPDNYAAVNLGQLKQAVLPFYQRLLDSGHIATLPNWLLSQGSSDDFQVVNIGQAKAAFNITFPSQSVQPESTDTGPAWSYLNSNLVGSGNEVANSLDTDRDGMKDATERLLFGDLGRDGSQDADEDGVLDRRELVTTTPGSPLWWDTNNDRRHDAQAPATTHGSTTTLHVLTSQRAGLRTAF